MNKPEEMTSHVASGLAIGGTIVLVYLIIAPALAGLAINLYEVMVAGKEWNGVAIFALYIYGAPFLLMSAIPHAFAQGWRPLWAWLVTVPLQSLILYGLDEKLGPIALITLSLCFLVAHRMTQSGSDALPPAAESAKPEA